MKIRHEGIERETEKAILTTIEVDTAIGFKGMKAWYPKSQIEYDDKVIDCPEWLMDRKLDEYVGDSSGNWALPVAIIN